jgi:hypothetical protein
MDEPKDCPRCRLVNPPTAQRCDCGWDFVSRTQQESYLQPKHRLSGLPLVVGIGGAATLVIIVLRVLFRMFGAAASGQ